MPFYRYACEDCGNEFRVLQRNGDEAHGACPHCGGTRAKRLLPRAGVIYKGSGYYSTDYRSKRSKAAKPAASDTGSEKKDGGDGVAATATPGADRTED